LAAIFGLSDLNTPTRTITRLTRDEARATAQAGKGF
jgi:hypothetical protein